jgi:hypothetical protein
VLTFAKPVPPNVRSTRWITVSNVRKPAVAAPKNAATWLRNRHKTQQIAEGSRKRGAIMYDVWVKKTSRYLYSNWQEASEKTNDEEYQIKLDDQV